MDKVGVRYRHKETFLTLRETASDLRNQMLYQKTYDYHGEFISGDHARLATKVTAVGAVEHEVDGWLLSADAQKLYELVYFCDGDVLELGVNQHLSTALIGEACESRSDEVTIVSIKADLESSREAHETLSGRPGIDRAHFFTNHLGTAVRDLARAKRYFGFAYVGALPEYEATIDACRDLHRVLHLGSFALFQEFNDPRNADLSQTSHSIYQAVLDGLNPYRFEFWGIFGSAGLFRRIGPF